LRRKHMVLPSYYCVLCNHQVELTCRAFLPFMPFCLGVLEPDSYLHTLMGSLWCSPFLQRSLTSKFLHGHHYSNVLDHLNGAKWFDLQRAATNSSLGSTAFQIWICSSCATSKSFKETIYRTWIESVM
jgi:hypothetical protein